MQRESAGLFTNCSKINSLLGKGGFRSGGLYLLSSRGDMSPHDCVGAMLPGIGFAGDHVRHPCEILFVTTGPVLPRWDVDFRSHFTAIVLPSGSDEYDFLTAVEGLRFNRIPDLIVLAGMEVRDIRTTIRLRDMSSRSGNCIIYHQKLDATICKERAGSEFTESAPNLHKLGVLQPRKVDDYVDGTFVLADGVARYVDEENRLTHCAHVWAGKRRGLIDDDTSNHIVVDYRRN